MTTGEIAEALRQFGNRLVWLALSGGEITLMEDLEELLSAAGRHCPNLRLVTFTTNGLLPEVATTFAKRIVDAGYDAFVTVSLDGDQALHDKLRGVNGNYDLAWQTYNSVRELGIRVHFGLTLSAENEEFVRERYAKLKSHIRAVTFMHSGGIYGQENLSDDSSILRSVHHIIEAYNPRGLDEYVEWLYLRLASLFLANGRKTNPIPCSVGHVSLHLRPNGSIQHCMFLPSLGNIRSGASFDDIINSPEAVEERRKIRSDQCPHCWMNCYAPHSMLMHPVSAARALLTGHQRSPG